ncbi:MAG: hypothetical protein FWC36_04870 [Spirochaetes bacterium]|nr:hypothetical protein [Spirochaetota bacterium]
MTQIENMQGFFSKIWLFIFEWSESRWQALQHGRHCLAVDLAQRHGCYYPGLVSGRDKAPGSLSAVLASSVNKLNGY